MTRDRVPRLLVVGPLPPPPCGPTVSFQLFCNEVGHHTETQRVEVIDSSPKRFKKQTRIVSAINFTNAWRVFWQFCRRVKAVDQVLIFGSNGFLLSMVPLLLVVAKIARKPCYVRAFGGSLDRFCDNLMPLFRRLLLFTLRHADGLIVQTELLYNHFAALIGDSSVHLVPGYRCVPPLENGRSNPVTKSGENLRLVFLGHVREGKGIFVLLESLRSLGSREREAIHCDIFGPVYESVAARFEDELAKTKNAIYGGVLSPEQVVPTLRNYDALVFPTYLLEGHPGVLIEAMMAGIPAITTDFRSIPELVEDRVNGLLIQPHDSKSLAEAIEAIYYDRQLLAEMAKRNWEMRTSYDARHVVPLISRALGV